MLLAWLLLGSTGARSTDAEAPLQITRFDANATDIIIDGRLSEAVWDTLPFYGKLVVVEPDTLADTPDSTQLRLFYTDEGMYVGIWNEQDPDTLISRLSSRDEFLTRDDVSLTLDTSGQGLYAYWFGISLSGSVIDGTVVPERNFSRRWDGPWHGAAAQLDDGWSAEMFLPWSMMTMPEVTSGKRLMGMYVSREVAHLNERWGWPALPRSKGLFMSQLQGIELEDVSPAQQFTFYPFAATTYDNTTNADSYKAGFDVFWRPATNLQLTATVNPDFGNVESDNVVVNLTSFETFFSEKRAFFLEGQEIFVTSPRSLDSFSSISPTTTLVNTRRIGSPPIDPQVDGFAMSNLQRNQPTELDGAAKVTGQRGRLRYGFLAATEDDTKLEGTIPSADDESVLEPLDYIQNGRDFGVARFLYEDTSTGARRSIGWMTTLVAHPVADAVVHGADGHYLSRNGRWAADAQLIRSDVDDTTGSGGFVDFTYTPQQGRKHELQFDYFDDDLDINDFGFLRRNDARGFRYAYQRSDSGRENLKSLLSKVWIAQEYNGDGKLVRSGIHSFQERLLNNNHLLFFELDYLPETWDDRNSGSGGIYKIDDQWQYGVQWRNSRADKLNVRLTFRDSQESLGGNDRQYEARFTWRPVDRFSMDLRFKYNARDGWLINSGGSDLTTYEAEVWRPQLELDYFFSARQQFRIAVQWAGIKAFEQRRWQIPAGGGRPVLDARAPTSSRDFSISRISFQARYRWEIAPLSDLFVVYTRGSNVPSDPRRGFEDLLSSAWTDAAVDVLVVKLRYRLGS